MKDIRLRSQAILRALYAVLVKGFSVRKATNGVAARSKIRSADAMAMKEQAHLLVANS